MANSKGNPKSLRSWRRGQSGNPAGRPINPPELKMIKSLKKGELALLINKILFARPEELELFDTTVLEKWIAQSVSRGIQVGDTSILFNIMDRLLGKTAPYFEDVQGKEVSEMTLVEKKRLFEAAKIEMKKLESEINDEEGQIEVHATPTR